MLSKGPPSPCPPAQKLYWHEAALPKHSTLSNPAFKSPPQKSGCQRSSGELGCGVPRHAVGCSSLAPGGLWWLGTTSCQPSWCSSPQPGLATAVMPLCGSALLPAWLGAWGEIPGAPPVPAAAGPGSPAFLRRAPAPGAAAGGGCRLGRGSAVPFLVPRHPRSSRVRRHRGVLLPSSSPSASAPGQM